MATVDELKSQRASLERVLNSGAESIQHGDKRTGFRSSSDIERQIRRLDEQITAAEGRKRRSGVFHVRTDRGY